MFFRMLFLYQYNVNFPNSDNIYSYILVIFFFIVSFVGFCVAFASGKIAKRMTIEWNEFSEIQAKHERPHVKNAVKEQLPAWKRVQIEQKNQKQA